MKKSKKRMLAMALSAAMAMSLLTGCSGGSDNPPAKESSGAAQESKSGENTPSPSKEEAQGDGDISLVMSWWGNQTRNERTTKALNLYSEQTGVSVEGQFYQWDDYWNKMSTSAAGNSLPDIIQMDYAYIAQYVDSGELIDLTPYIDSGAIDTTNIESSVLETGKVNDKVYGMVAGLTCVCLFYNKTVTDSLGIEIKNNMTIDEFVDIAKEVTDKTGYRANLISRSSYLSYWARAKGIPIVEAASPVDSYEPYVEVFKLLEDGVKEGWHLTPDCIDSSAIETDPLVYGSGPETMAWCTVNGGSNLLTSFQDSAPEGVEIGLTTLPTSNPKASNSLGVSQFFCVSSDCKDVDAAVALIDWLINSTECNDILLAERGVPASSLVADALSPQLNETTAKAMDYVVNVIEVNCSPMDPPTPDGSSELSSTLAKLQEAVGYGEMSADEAAQEYYNKMIELWGE